MKSEIVSKADFSGIRYAQCWEDADVLMEALRIRPGAHCLSIASAGDNSLAMLAFNPGKVTAIDLSEAQLACCRLRVAAYSKLDHHELLELMGSVKSDRRWSYYMALRPLLDEETRRFWDSRPLEVENGIGGAGKFEKYFKLFRSKMMPLVHNKSTIKELLRHKSLQKREQFYREKWDTWRWKAMFSFFFSRTVLGKMGRDPSFFRYVEGSVASRVMSRTEYALTKLDPSKNSYLQWILTGRHLKALPFALREENFDSIRSNLDRLELRKCSVEEYLAETEDLKIDAFNLSDIFEYMSTENTNALLRLIVSASAPEARIAYWNLFAPRSRPDSMANCLKSMEELSQNLFARDQAFFYGRFVVEEVISENVSDNFNMKLGAPSDAREMNVKSGTASDINGAIDVTGDSISADRLQADRPDSVLYIEEEAVVDADSPMALRARSSLWWNDCPEYKGMKTGFIGHFAASDREAAMKILLASAVQMRKQGCDIAIGPMDGSTWKKYRLVNHVGEEKTFFLEPENPSYYVEWFEQAGFSVIEKYHSSVAENLERRDARIERARKRLEKSGITVRNFQLEHFEEEVKRIHDISINSFGDNVLYKPIAYDEILRMYRPLKDYIRPEMVLIAEDQGQPAGFVFNIPDYNEIRRNEPLRTMILKTVAVIPERRYAGLGTMLVADSHVLAQKLGFKRVIHALMHSSNNSRNISSHYAEMFRQYGLYGMKL